MQKKDLLLEISNGEKMQEFNMEDLFMGRIPLEEYCIKSSKLRTTIDELKNRVSNLI